MASSTSKAESVFKGFSVAQAAEYAQLRGSYPKELYEFIAKHHASTGGKTGLVMDVGCGPGNVTRDVARHFDEAIGVDHGDDMVKAATKIGGETAAGNPIRYYASSAEEFDKLGDVPAGHVDMITVGTAAHWFDMAKFWSAAANVVKPGGTVAIWAYVAKYCHPSMPGAEKVHRIIFDWDENVLGPYMQPGNSIVRNGYKDLVLPWAAECPEDVRIAFDETTFKRKVWNADGVLSDDGEFFGGSREVTLAGIEQLAGTGSPIVRWREAHPDLAGTEQDCVRVMVKQIQEALGIKEGEEDKAKIKIGTSIVLLLAKRA